MPKIKLNSSLTIEEAFANFLLSKRAEGLSEKSIQCYKGHLKCIAKHLDITAPLQHATKKDFEKMVASLRATNLSNNTIASYVATTKSFLSWARREGLSDVNIPKYKTEETIKETYTDEELMLLLQKPNLNNCSFTEYRNWVIINFLLNSGARASTIRARGIFIYVVR